MLLKKSIFPQKVSDKSDDELFLQASVTRLRIGKLNQNDLQYYYFSSKIIFTNSKY